MFKSTTYTERRAGLRQLLKNASQSGIVILMGNAESPRNYAGNTYAMRQDSTFLYYCGLDRHDFALILDLDNGMDTLYGDDYTVDDIIWMGPQPSVADAAALCGIEHSAPMSAMAEAIEKASSRKVHILPPYRTDNAYKLSQWLSTSIENLKNYVSMPLVDAVVAGREIKSAEEITQIEDACAIGYQMHTTAMKMCRQGVTERQIAGALEGISLSLGSGVSFHSIISQRGETLHNHDHSGVLKKGSLLLVDAGAENVNNYCSDSTRTMPVGGKFSPMQRDVYNIVLAANQKAHSLARAGITYQSVHIEAAKVLVEGLKSLGLMKGDVNDAVMAGAVAMYMPHGLGHQMGLDVHDMEDLGERFVGYDKVVERSQIDGISSLRMGKTLKTGHVVTVEPGLYFIPALVEKWAAEKRCAEFIDYNKARSYFGFGGIRLEDDIVITDSGCRQLGDNRIPITIDDVEAFMGEL